MKTFIILNGTEVHVVEKDNLREATIYAEDNVSRSGNILVQEVTNFTYASKLSFNVKDLIVQWHKTKEEFKDHQSKATICAKELIRLNELIFTECHKLNIQMPDLR